MLLHAPERTWLGMFHFSGMSEASRLPNDHFFPQACRHRQGVHVRHFGTPGPCPYRGQANKQSPYQGHIKTHPYRGHGTKYGPNRGQRIIKFRPVPRAKKESSPYRGQQRPISPQACRHRQGVHVRHFFWHSRPLPIPGTSQQQSPHQGHKKIGPYRGHRVKYGPYQGEE